jgi:DNA-binding NtrC family response regulator
MSNLDQNAPNQQNGLPAADALFITFAGSLEGRRKLARQITKTVEEATRLRACIYEDREGAGGSNSLIIAGSKPNKLAETSSWTFRLGGEADAAGGSEWRSTLRLIVVGQPEAEFVELLERLASECSERASSLLLAPEAGDEGALVQMGMVVAGEATREVVRQTRMYAPERACVLIIGESGTGKERIARNLHEASGRAGEFLALNCGSIPKELIESRLFGHEKGAFTGAVTVQKGAFEATDGGTLFLDEIGEMPEEQQVTLLRVLEDGLICRLGSNTPKRVNVRVVAATNRPLEEMVREGKFRRDLYYRLAGLNINVLPLRERREEIVPLALHHVEKMAAEHGVSLSITDEAFAALEHHSWEGNVRELVNRLDRGRIHAREGVIGVAELGIAPAPDAQPQAAAVCSIERSPRRVEAAAVVEADAPVAEVIEDVTGDSFEERVRAYERRLILEALTETGYNAVPAAKMLGLRESTLRRKIRDLGIERPADSLSASKVRTGPRASRGTLHQFATSGRAAAGQQNAVAA